MAENPSHTLLTESVDRLRHGEFEEFADIWRHEGLKKLVEFALYQGGNHELGRLALKYLVGGRPVNDPRLHTKVGNLEMAGPAGLAPGWDKTGKTLQAWQALGARHKTDGGTTFFSQAGKRMPRLRTFDNQLGDHGVDISLNAFGFWNHGWKKLVYNIQKQREISGVHIPLIVQATLNEEYYQQDKQHMLRDMLVGTIVELLPVADGISLGLTSPNTPNMRDKQDQFNFLSEITAAASYAVKSYDEDKTLIFKGDGDGGEERWHYYCRLATFRDRTCDAFELINTTRLLHIWAKYGMDPEKIPGGLAGADPDYQQLALDAVKYVYEGAGDTIDIIGTGGIDSPEQALKMIEAGASAVGINTAVRKLGLGVMKHIERGLVEKIDGQYPDVSSLDQIIGVKTERGAKAFVERHDHGWHIKRRNEQWMKENPPERN
jgi:dihydroorotate dehydrogenase